MDIEQKLFETVTDLIKRRYPEGWGGAAAMCLEGGTIVTSIAPEVINASTELCMETGSILEAHKLNKKITHSICVVRDDENSEFKVLSPCGICQERLFYWGPNVKVAVSLPGKDLVFKTLAEVQPYHWSSAYSLFNE
ncbi:cytidine deaminase [Oceanobacillus kimchii]|uniref:cytidine deaminase n=1 Tax=Oceanobacillus kimchii TaxID=746691 RepID=UPI0021A467FC|nr:cytidine deaminase [Oceanobacillus kimchii]MCT1577832.1 cytidine deaminase [Oceanobacillus kimchii]MCT2136820.1 cytidine deaminase [Oceanobacillus kimchii]